jgi:uncharacterized membrane protein
VAPGVFGEQVIVGFVFLAVIVTAMARCARRRQTAPIAFGLLWFLVQKKKNPVLLSLLVFALSYYVFFINLILFNFARFNMPICIILSFFGGYFLSNTLAAGKPILGAVKLTIILIFLYSLLYASSIDIAMLKDSRYAAERWMKANIQPNDLVGFAC